MNFALAIHTSYGVKTEVIQTLSNELERYFTDKDYGNDVKSYTIGILCVSPQFDQFYSKPYKPKYTKGKKIIKPHGIPYTLEDSYEYRVKIDFDSFTKANEEDAKKLLANEILTSLSVLGKLPGKMKDFDVGQFKADLYSFFENN